MSDKGLAAIVVAGVFVFVAFLAFIIALDDKDAQECEDRGGHVYSRQVGKVHYHKCVTDDNVVLD